MPLFIRLASLVLVAIMLSACQSSMMQVKEDVSYEPRADQSLFVFMRPSYFGGAIQSSVYDVTDGQTKFIGVVSAGTKLAYYTTPGEKLFMVLAENADFMGADVLPGKTYYGLVSPRMGVWKARFSLLPVRMDENAKYSLQSSEFSSWQEKTSWVVLTPEAEAWFEENRDGIEEKKIAYLEKWDAKPAEDVAVLTLNPEDGM